MTIETRVPENLDVTPPTAAGFGTLVGGDTALVTSDGDTSYAECRRYAVDNVGVLSAGHTFQWTPAGPIPPDAIVTIEADWVTEGPNPGGFSVAFEHPTLSGRSVGSFTPETGFATHDYGDLGTITVPTTWVVDGAAFMPGVVWQVRPLVTDGGSTSNSSRITRLTMFIETTGGPEPLRLRQRSDGLGLGSNRVRGIASRQLSVRVRGYL